MYGLKYKDEHRKIELHQNGKGEAVTTNKLFNGHDADLYKTMGLTMKGHILVIHRTF